MLELRWRFPTIRQGMWLSWRPRKGHYPGVESYLGGGMGHRLTEISGDSWVSADPLASQGGSGVRAGDMRGGRADHLSNSAGEEDCVEWSRPMEQGVCRTSGTCLQRRYQSSTARVRRDWVSLQRRGSNFCNCDCEKTLLPISVFQWSGEDLKGRPNMTAEDWRVGSLYDRERIIRDR